MVKRILIKWMSFNDLIKVKKNVWDPIMKRMDRMGEILKEIYGRIKAQDREKEGLDLTDAGKTNFKRPCRCSWCPSQNLLRYPVIASTWSKMLHLSILKRWLSLVRKQRKVSYT